MAEYVTFPPRESSPVSRRLKDPWGKRLSLTTRLDMNRGTSTFGQGVYGLAGVSTFYGGIPDLTLARWQGPDDTQPLLAQQQHLATNPNRGPNKLITGNAPTLSSKSSSMDVGNSARGFVAPPQAATQLSTALHDDGQGKSLQDTSNIEIDTDEESEGHAQGNNMARETPCDEVA